MPNMPIMPIMPKTINYKLKTFNYKMNLHHIKTDNDNGTKYLEIALNNAIKAVENYETDKIILHDIPTSIFGNFKFTGTISFNGDIVEIKTNKFNLLYGKTSCKCVITSLAKSVKL